MTDEEFHIPLGGGHPCPIELAHALWDHLAKTSHKNERGLGPLVSNMLTAKGWKGCSKTNVYEWHKKGWPPRTRPQGAQPNPPRKQKADKAALQGALVEHIIKQLELPPDIKAVFSTEPTDAELGQIFNREVLKAGIAIARQMQEKPHILVLMGKEAEGLFNSFANVGTKLHMLGDPLLKMVPAEPANTIDVAPNGHAALIEETPLASVFRKAKAAAAA